LPAIENAYQAWERLRPKWNDYLVEAGLDLTGTPIEHFADDLLAPIRIDFRLPGLEDLCRSASRGIEPGDPARSLLYHALASPGVTPPGLEDGDYPTPEELQAIEDLVYGIVPPSLEDLRVRAEGGPLAIVVFAYEYTPAADTVHKRHADLCFSRTGLSRIGNVRPRYVPKARGYLPFSDDDPAVHAVPCRFGAFLATTRKGDRKTIGPERFQPGDSQRDFWIPLHKLFSGPDCIDGCDLRVELAAHHVNDKIRRIHLALQQEGEPMPWSPQELNEYPFRIAKEIAEFGRGANYNLLTPLPHEIVEVARKADGTIVSFAVPKNHKVAEGALWFEGQQNAQHSPELVHVKHALVDGEVESLLKPRGKSIGDLIQHGGYQAVNFVDHTADGWVEAHCNALTAYVPVRLAAYSLVAQPDFFPLVQQKALMEWWENSAPPELKDNIFPYDQLLPIPLTDERIAVNITLEGAGFDSTDQTMTAIVGLPRPPQAPGRIRPFVVERESTLSLRATGLFFPGWDASRDFNTDDRSPNGVLHLAHYGIGSPFVEDTMICSAHGSFWPAATPDTTRFFPPGRYPSTTPLLDSDAGWDGVPLPARKGANWQFRNLIYTDYVELLRQSKLTYGQFAGITLSEYVARTLAMSRAFQVLGATTTAARLSWAVLEFRRATEKELAAIPHSEWFDGAPTFRLRMAQMAGTDTVAGRNDLTAGEPAATEVLYASASAAARKSGERWNVQQF